MPFLFNDDKSKLEARSFVFTSNEERQLYVPANGRLNHEEFLIGSFDGYKAIGVVGSSITSRGESDTATIGEARLKDEQTLSFEVRMPAVSGQPQERLIVAFTILYVSDAMLYESTD